MDLQPPEGSKISVRTDGADPAIIIPPNVGATRYFGALFLLFWLGMWTMGFRDAATKVMSGNAPAFLVFWLAAWTVGGVAAVLTLYRLVRPAIPESLELGRNSMLYDSGIAPLEFNIARRTMNPKQAWNSLFPKRVRAELDRRKLQTLRLRETETSNRLTIDIDANRIELAPTATEIEREWLARLLARRYALPAVFATAGIKESAT